MRLFEALVNFETTSKQKNSCSNTTPDVLCYDELKDKLLKKFKPKHNNLLINYLAHQLDLRNLLLNYDNKKINDENFAYHLENLNLIEVEQFIKSEQELLAELSEETKSLFWGAFYLRVWFIKGNSSSKNKIEEYLNKYPENPIVSYLLAKYLSCKPLDNLLNSLEFNFTPAAYHLLAHHHDKIDELIKSKCQNLIENSVFFRFEGVFKEKNGFSDLSDDDIKIACDAVNQGHHDALMHLRNHEIRTYNSSAFSTRETEHFINALQYSIALVLHRGLPTDLLYLSSNLDRSHERQMSYSRIWCMEK